MEKVKEVKVVLLGDAGTHDFILALFIIPNKNRGW